MTSWRTTWNACAPTASTRGIDDAMDAYRTGLAYGYFLWAITLVVKPEIIRVLLQRLSAATAADDSFGALGV